MSKPKNTVSKRDTLAGLVQFGFEGEPVRMVMESDMPWFNANDVCQALGYENSRKALADHVDDKDVTKRYTLSRGVNQESNFVNELRLEMRLAK